MVKSKFPTKRKLINHFGDYKNYPYSNMLYANGVKPGKDIDRDQDGIVDWEDCDPTDVNKQALSSGQKAAIGRARAKNKEKTAAKNKSGGGSSNGGTRYGPPAPIYGPLVPQPGDPGFMGPVLPRPYQGPSEGQPGFVGPVLPSPSGGVRYGPAIPQPGDPGFMGPVQLDPSGGGGGLSNIQQQAIENARRENIRKQAESSVRIKQDLTKEQNRISSLRSNLLKQGAQTNIRNFIDSKTGHKIQYETLIKNNNERIYITRNLTTGKVSTRTFEKGKRIDGKLKFKGVQETGGITSRGVTQSQVDEIQKGLPSGDILIYDVKNMVITGIKSSVLGKTIPWTEKDIKFYDNQIEKLGPLAFVQKESVSSIESRSVPEGKYKPEDLVIIGVKVDLGDGIKTYAIADYNKKVKTIPKDKRPVPTSIEAIYGLKKDERGLRDSIKSSNIYKNLAFIGKEAFSSPKESIGEAALSGKGKLPFIRGGWEVLKYGAFTPSRIFKEEIGKGGEKLKEISPRLGSGVKLGSEFIPTSFGDVGLYYTGTKVIKVLPKGSSSKLMGAGALIGIGQKAAEDISILSVNGKREIQLNMKNSLIDYAVAGGTGAAMGFLFGYGANKLGKLGKIAGDKLLTKIVSTGGSQSKIALFNLAGVNIKTIGNVGGGIIKVYFGYTTGGETYELGRAIYDKNYNLAKYKLTEIGASMIGFGVGDKISNWDTKHGLKLLAKYDPTNIEKFRKTIPQAQMAKQLTEGGDFLISRRGPYQTGKGFAPREDIWSALDTKVATKGVFFRFDKTPTKEAISPLPEFTKITGGYKKMFSSNWEKNKDLSYYNRLKNTLADTPVMDDVLVRIRLNLDPMENKELANRIIKEYSLNGKLSKNTQKDLLKYKDSHISDKNREWFNHLENELVLRKPIKLEKNPEVSWTMDSQGNLVTVLESGVGATKLARTKRVISKNKIDANVDAQYIKDNYQLQNMFKDGIIQPKEHSYTHMKNVEKNMKKLFDLEKQYDSYWIKTYGSKLKAWKELKKAMWHDLAKYGETSQEFGIGHGQAMARAVKLAPDYLPRELATIHPKVREAIKVHESIDPSGIRSRVLRDLNSLKSQSINLNTNQKGIFNKFIRRKDFTIHSIKEVVRGINEAGSYKLKDVMKKISPEAKILATADRMDLTRYGIKVDQSRLPLNVRLKINVEKKLEYSKLKTDTKSNIEFKRMNKKINEEYKSIKYDTFKTSPLYKTNREIKISYPQINYKTSYKQVKYEGIKYEVDRIITPEYTYPTPSTSRPSPRVIRPTPSRPTSRTPSYPGIYTTPIIPPPEIPTTALPWLPTPKLKVIKKKKKFVQGYHVYARPLKKKGQKVKPKLKRVPIPPLPYTEALDTRNFILDTSLARTGGVIKTIKKIQPNPLNVPKGYAQQTQDKFRDYRIVKGQRVPMKGNKVIEKSKRLLDTSQERGKISFEKRMAQLQREGKQLRNIGKYKKPIKKKINNKKVVKKKRSNNLQNSIKNEQERFEDQMKKNRF